MSTYRDLLSRTKAEISEVDATGAQALEGAIWVDVREADEWEQGHLPNAVLVPRGNLESRIERVAPDKAKPVVLYCAVGARSAFAAAGRRRRTRRDSRDDRARRPSCSALSAAPGPASSRRRPRDDRCGRERDDRDDRAHACGGGHPGMKVPAATVYV